MGTEDLTQPEPHYTKRRTNGQGHHAEKDPRIAEACAGRRTGRSAVGGTEICSGGDEQKKRIGCGPGQLTGLGLCCMIWEKGGMGHEKTVMRNDCIDDYYDGKRSQCWTV